VMGTMNTWRHSFKVGRTSWVHSLVTFVLRPVIVIHKKQSFVTVWTWDRKGKTSSFD
jgi:hypothetical protein